MGSRVFRGAQGTSPGNPLVIRNPKSVYRYPMAFSRGDALRITEYRLPITDYRLPTTSSNMKIPVEIPGLRAATFLLVILLLLWIAPEGDIRRVTVMGVLVTAVLLAHLLQYFLRGKWLSLKAWLAATAVGGLLFGLGSGLLTLGLMIFKTGLHAHGPEFSPAEIDWVWRQIPLRGLVGLLAALGLGMITATLSRE
jgi:hypothetical protein